MKKSVSSFLILAIFFSLFSIVFVIAESKGSNEDYISDNSINNSDSSDSVDNEEINELEVEEEVEEEKIESELRQKYESERREILADGTKIRTRIREEIRDGEEIKIKLREELRQGQDELELFIKKEVTGLELRIRNSTAHTELEIESEYENESGENKTKLKIKLKNGNYSFVKVMPDVASQVALERLKLNFCSENNNCSIELKEVGEGNKTRIVYETRAEKKFRILGLFNSRNEVEIQLDSETGEVIRTKKPWWSFLASEKNIGEDSSENLEEEDLSVLENESLS